MDPFHKNTLLLDLMERQPETSEKDQENWALQISLEKSNIYISFFHIPDSLKASASNCIHESVFTFQPWTRSKFS